MGASYVRQARTPDARTSSKSVPVTEVERNSCSSEKVYVRCASFFADLQQLQGKADTTWGIYKPLQITLAWSLSYRLTLRKN